VFAVCCSVLQCAAVCCDSKRKDALENAKDRPSFSTGNTRREKTACLRARELDAQSKAQDTLIVTPPPLRGDFFIGWVSNQAPGARGPPLKNNPVFPQKLGWVFSGGPLAPGSWFGNHPDKNPPPGGGGFFNQRLLAEEKRAERSQRVETDATDIDASNLEIDLTCRLF